jgi:hypothetical protein
MEDTVAMPRVETRRVAVRSIAWLNVSLFEAKSQLLKWERQIHDQISEHKIAKIEWLNDRI